MDKLSEIFMMQQAFDTELVEHFLTGVCCKLIKSDFLKKNKIFFPEGIKTGEDLDFVVKVVNNAVRIKYFPLSVYRYEFDPSTGNGRIEKDPIGAIRDINYVMKVCFKI